MDQLGTPHNLDEAVETLIGFYANVLPEIKEMTEKEFWGSAHYAAGTFIRNTWYLWWYEGHAYKEWPAEKPLLVQWFQDEGFSHPDDMSDEVLRALWKKVQEENSL